MLAPELAEPRRDAGNRARCGADRVVDELLPERHFEPSELRLPRLGAEPGDGAEAVEVAHTSRVPVEVDRVTAAEQAGHHRLGDAGSERRRDGGVGGRASVLEDLDAGGGRRRMTGSDRGCQLRGSATHAIRATPSFAVRRSRTVLLMR